jgi:itaconate CoA-transferase
MRHPLDGLTVVSLEQAVAAPFATRQLADLGARVIKIERPGGGDFARGYDRTTLGQSSHFIWLNRGKESVELDVKDPGDRDLLGRLIDAADVFVQNLAPGAADRLGLSPSALRADRPRLICCSISGYGPDGPYRDKKAYDLLVQCETGLVMATGTPESPARPGISIADIAAGMYAYTGILTALYDRERTGAGTALHVAMIDALSEWMTQPVYFSHYGGQPLPRTGARHPSISPYGPFNASDGAVFFGIQNEREWLVFCNDVLRRGDLATDARFASNPDRAARNDELTAIIEDSFSKQTADEVIAALEEAGIACARLRTPGEQTEHPELRARGRWRPVRTPEGDVDALLPTVQAAGQEPVMGPVPAFGEHTESIRAEFGPAGPVRLSSSCVLSGAIRLKVHTMMTMGDLDSGISEQKPRLVPASGHVGQMSASARSAFPPSTFMISSSLSPSRTSQAAMLWKASLGFSSPSTYSTTGWSGPADAGCPSRPAKVRCRPTWSP